MKETTLRLLPGRLMLVAAILFLVGGAFIARSASKQSYVLVAVGIMWLCIGIFSLRRARRPK
jgi:uncharacterized membrane protein HdeD (DUF308 family)